jgi:hypothetical protein
VVVAARDHSRRLRRVLDRAMKGHPTRVTVRAERYSNFDPDRWWETRGGVRTEIIELQKLVLDVVCCNPCGCGWSHSELPSELAVKRVRSSSA